MSEETTTKPGRAKQAAAPEETTPPENIHDVATWLAKGIRPPDNDIVPGIAFALDDASRPVCNPDPGNPMWEFRFFEPHEHIKKPLMRQEGWCLVERNGHIMSEAFADWFREEAWDIDGMYIAGDGFVRDRESNRMSAERMLYVRPYAAKRAADILKARRWKEKLSGNPVSEQARERSDEFRKHLRSQGIDQDIVKVGVGTNQRSGWLE